MFQSQTRPTKSGRGHGQARGWTFSLIELLVVIATIAIFAGLLAAALPTGAETAEARPALKPSEKADTFLNGLIKTNDAGMAVLVAQDGKIIFEKGYGQADVEHHVPITPQTTFRIASVTKQFTASAILKLQEEGKLSVDDKLSKYIPDFPRGDEVTLRELLNHTSGIYNYNRKGYIAIGATNATTTEAIIEMIKKYPYDFDPGTQWRYDNSGYVLLGYIVAKVSGQTYGDFLRENFFQPLGMTNTGVYRAHLGLPHEALGYSLGTNGFEPAPDWDPSWTAGNGAIYSTVEDLYRWNEGLFNGQVLDAASLKAAFTAVKTTESQGYGFGWFIDRYHGLRMMSHSGGFPGFTSWLMRLPDKKFTVVILANALPGRELHAGQLVDIFMADKHAEVKVDPTVYDTLVGKYDCGHGTMLTVTREGNQLFAQLTGQQKFEIFPESETEYFLKVVDAQVTFVKDAVGKTTKAIIHQGGRTIDAPKIQ